MMKNKFHYALVFALFCAIFFPNLTSFKHVSFHYLTRKPLNVVHNIDHSNSFTKEPSSISGSNTEGNAALNNISFGKLNNSASLNLLRQNSYSMVQSVVLAKYCNSILKYKSYFKRWTDDERRMLNDSISLSFYMSLEISGKSNKSFGSLLTKSVAMAQVLGEMRCAPEAVVAAILLNTIQYIYNQNHMEAMHAIEKKFNPKIVQISLSYMKLPQYTPQSNYSLEQAERFIQYLVLKCEDYTTLYLRIAEKICELRQIKEFNSKEKKIAQEVLCVYVPLVHKMGVEKIKSEMEDKAFRILNSEMFGNIKIAQILAGKVLQVAQEKVISSIKEDKFLNDNLSLLQFSHRIKSKYQIFLKMKRKQLASPRDVLDILGLRIVFDYYRKVNETESEYDARGKDLCYYLAELIHTSVSEWKLLFGGFKDYVANSKTNGYQSIHEYIYDSTFRTNMEIQIRTFQMHLDAQSGKSAHWFYKDTLYRTELAHSKLYRLVWRSKEQIESKSTGEMFAIAKNYLLHSRVFVYLEDKCHLIDLKCNSTALDAALSVHTAIGLSAKEIIVNGIPVTFSHVLKSGDVISVVSSADNKPTANISWFRQVTNSNSLSILRKHFRLHDYKSAVRMGLSQIYQAILCNEQLIVEKYTCIPTTARIINWMNSRLGQSLPEGLFHLGTTSTDDEATIVLSKLFKVPISLKEAAALGKECGNSSKLSAVDDQAHCKIFQNTIFPLALESSIFDEEEIRIENFVT